MDEHPLSHSDRDVLDPSHKVIAEQARTIFSNVYEPPIEDACVSINVLEQDLNIEDIMDDVTSAMSIDALMNEVGEKTAFRRRLLNAWQMVAQLEHNADIQNHRRHLFNACIIAFTFVSVLLGTINFECSKAVKLSKIMDEPVIYLGMPVTDGPGSLIWWLDGMIIALPMITSLFLALDSSFSPTTKWTALYHHQLYVESEIYKVRTRTGEYSSHAAVAAATSSMGTGGTGGGKRGEGEHKEDKKDSKTSKSQLAHKVFFFCVAYERQMLVTALSLSHTPPQPTSRRRPEPCLQNA